jgi:hypothetical protein
MARRAVARRPKGGRKMAVRGMADVGALAGEAKRVIVGIKVKFELNSKTGLRRVIFGLEKDTQGDDVIWKIHFELYERDKKSTSYDDALVNLDLEIDAKLNKKAEDTAHNGLTAAQAAHAIGPAADDAKAAKNGEIEEDEAADTVQATLRKR